MTKTIQELQQELVEKQTAALHRVFDAVAASSEIELGFNKEEASLISRAAMGKLWARQREDYVKKARNEAKAEYLAAEVEYAEKQAKRIREVNEKVFGVNQDASTEQMLELATASPEVLGTMLTMSLEAGNGT